MRISCALLAEKKEACVNLEITKGEHQHRETHHLVGKPEDLPEAYLVNMNYSHWQTGQASAMDILALMLSIPENFCPKKDLYNHRE